MDGQIMALQFSDCCVTVALFSPSGPHSCRMQTEERQRLLQEQYYFLCQCDACSLQTQQQEVEDTQWSGLYEAGFLCGKCKGSLKVGDD